MQDWNNRKNFYIFTKTGFVCRGSEWQESLWAPHRRSKNQYFWFSSAAGSRKDSRVEDGCPHWSVQASNLINWDLIYWDGPQSAPRLWKQTPGGPTTTTTPPTSWGSHGIEVNWLFVGPTLPQSLTSATVSSLTAVFRVFVGEWGVRWASIGLVRRKRALGDKLSAVMRRSKVVCSQENLTRCTVVLIMQYDRYRHQTESLIALQHTGKLTNK